MDPVTIAAALGIDSGWWAKQKDRGQLRATVIIQARGDDSLDQSELKLYFIRQKINKITE